MKTWEIVAMVVTGCCIMIPAIFFFVLWIQDSPLLEELKGTKVERRHAKVYTGLSWIMLFTAFFSVVMFVINMITCSEFFSSVFQTLLPGALYTWGFFRYRAMAEYVATLPEEPYIGTGMLTGSIIENAMKRKNQVAKGKHDT